MVYVVCSWFLLFLLYSILGYIIEVISVSIHAKKLVFNRGFLIGPYLPIYGFGSLIMVLFLTRYENDLLALFVMSAFLCTLLEYVTSLIMEKIFQLRWWDYSDRKFNINGRVCLQNLILFGILGTTIVFLVNPFFIKYISKIPELALHIILVFITILFLADTIISYKVIFDLKDMSKEFRDNTEEISEKVQKRIRSWKIRLYRRLVKAFPEIKEYVKYNTWEEIKKKIEESRNDIKVKIENSKKEFNEKIKDSKREFSEKIQDTKKEVKKKINKSKKKNKKI